MRSNQTTSDTCTKAILADEIYTTLGLSRREADLAVSALFQAIRMALSRGQKIELKGIGTLSPGVAAESTHTVPTMERPVIAPRRLRAHFRPSKTLLKALANRTSRQK